MALWKTIDPVMASLHAPKKGGCYAFFMDGKLAYIGQTNNLRIRMCRHRVRPAYVAGVTRTPWGDCREVVLKIKTYPRYGEWAMEELRLIRRLNPPMNFTLKKKATR